MESCRVLLISDVHLCSSDWYGRPSRERLQKMVEDIKEYHQNTPCKKIFFLGDYSLDFWAFNGGGCWLNEGKSDTADFITEIASQLPVPYEMIPGNHEQYGAEDWMKITGFPREYFVECGGYLFVMLDTFAGELDPKVHSDGVYSGANVALIRQALEQVPQIPVILCAHYFDMERETTAFLDLLRAEKRITALFCGHDHIIRIDDLGEQCGNLPLIHEGNYSYIGENGTPEDLMWGFEEVVLGEEGIQVAYIEPENEILFDGQPVHCPYRKQLTAMIPNRISAAKKEEQ